MGGELLCSVGYREAATDLRCSVISLLTSHGSSYGLLVFKDCFVQLIAEEIPYSQNLWRKDRGAVKPMTGTSEEFEPTLCCLLEYTPSFHPSRGHRSQGGSDRGHLEGSGDEPALQSATHLSRVCTYSF